MLNQRFAFAFLAASALVTSAAAVAQADTVIIPSGVADALQGNGTGLCIAQAFSQAPKTIDLISVQQKSAYNGILNDFMEAHVMDRDESVLRTLFDLSNNNITGTKASLGDYTNAVAKCKLGGCNFIINDDVVASMGLRARGYLNVKPEMVAKPVHFAFYTDDAVSLTFFGGKGASYPVITREVVVGFPTWRVTNTVTFQQPGLYPLEILYAEIGEHAALELAYKVDKDLTDFDCPASQDDCYPGKTVVKLKAEGFELFSPEMFSQTVSGQQSFPEITACQQCPRSDVNAPGNSTCPEGFYCNDAALCGPCDSATICGPTCSPCGGNTPFCINVNGQFECGGCEEDSQCADPANPDAKCKCDAATHTCECHECDDDDECPKGQVCENQACTPCVDNGECAGNSCNCCPKTAEGKQMVCGTLAGDSVASCVECTNDSDCEGGTKCDPHILRCVKELFKNEDPDCCGEGCEKCPKDDPITGLDWFCLPTHIGTACSQCRHDMDCGDGNYCRSGICVGCLDDKRCGVRCESCGGDTPFCFGSGSAENGSCVRCLSSADCGGNDCDSVLHKCQNACAMSCHDATPYCFGEKCVECYADTQCPCGGTCKLETNTCTTSCKDNGDCQGTDHCKYNDDDEGQTKECSVGQQPDDVGCGSTLGHLCQKSSVGVGLPIESPIPVTGAVVVSSLLLVSRRRKRATPKDNRERSGS